MPSQRSRNIPPFQVMSILARAKALEAQGRDVIHLEVGEPDFSTPAPIVAAGVHALQQGNTHYTPATGLPELHQAIADFYQQRYSCSVAASRVAVTTGASAALQLVIAALVDPGDTVLMANPGYPCNQHFVTLNGGEVVFTEVNDDSAWQPNLGDVEAFCEQGGRAVLLASPANPTGTLIAPEVLQAIVEMTERYGVWLIIDEIYHGLLHQSSTNTAVNLGEQVVVINSFSKYFGMTGWRLGWAILPDSLSQTVERLAQNLYLAPPTVAQHAALAAFLPETIAELEQRRHAFTQRRDVLLSGLQALGFSLAAPADGAFYLYMDAAAVMPVGSSASEFALDMLEKTGVAFTPGTDFDSTAQAEQRVRFAYTTDVARLTTACQRIALALSGSALDDQI